MEKNRSIHVERFEDDVCQSQFGTETNELASLQSKHDCTEPISMDVDKDNDKRVKNLPSITEKAPFLNDSPSSLPYSELVGVMRDMCADLKTIAPPPQGMQPTPTPLIKPGSVCSLSDVVSMTNLHNDTIPIGPNVRILKKNNVQKTRKTVRNILNGNVKDIGANEAVLVAPISVMSQLKYLNPQLITPVTSGSRDYLRAPLKRVYLIGADAITPVWISDSPSVTSQKSTANTITILSNQTGKILDGTNEQNIKVKRKPEDLGTQCISKRSKDGDHFVFTVVKKEKQSHNDAGVSCRPHHLEVKSKVEQPERKPATKGKSF